VHVLEAAPEFGEIGAGIQLGPNATRVLDRLGVLEQIERHAVAPDRLRLMDAVTGEQITSLDLGLRFRERFGYPYLVLHRRDLHAELADACRAHPHITLETGRAAETVEDLGDGARLRTRDGSVYEADALIGADGLWSVVRRLLSDDQPVQWPHVAYRGTIPTAELPDGGAGVVNDVFMWVGPDAHFVQYPVRGGELYNQVAVFKSDRYDPDSDDWGGPDELDERFGRLCEQVRSARVLLERNQRWPMYDRAPIRSWVRNSIALVGDAAHPMLQYIAQGGCQALEDAASLSAAFEHYGSNVQAAFEHYEYARVQRAARVQRTARLWGEVCHVDGIGATLRNVLLSRRAPDDFAELDWLYGSQAAVLA
jgi:salicylate hydroxylase